METVLAGGPQVSPAADSCSADRDSRAHRQRTRNRIEFCKSLVEFIRYTRRKHEDVPEEEHNVEMNPWTVDEIVASTGLPNHTVRKFVRGEELLTAAKRMVRSKKQVPYYFRSAAQLLYAISLEAGLKALWEIDNKGPAARTHELSQVFAGLNPSRRDMHNQWYGLIANQAGSSVSLEAALMANAKMVRDFKYGDYDGTTAGVIGGEVIGDIVVGSYGALISYGQFVIDDLELAISECVRFADRSRPS